jgi:hypothetical protein
MRLSVVERVWAVVIFGVLVIPLSIVLGPMLELEHLAAICLGAILIAVIGAKCIVRLIRRFLFPQEGKNE